MIKLQYYSHLMLNSRYSLLIKLTIFLAIYMMFYLDNIHDVAFCAKRSGAKRAAEIARAVPASEVSAVPFIAESKDEVVRGFHEQLKAIQLDNKIKHEETKASLAELKRLYERKHPAPELAETKNTNDYSYSYTKDRAEYWEKEFKKERLRHNNQQKQTQRLIQELEKLRQVNRTLTQTVAEQEQYARRLIDTTLPAEIPTMESKTTQTGETYPNERFRHATGPRVTYIEGFAEADFAWDPENPWYREDAKNTDTITNVQEYIQQNCNIS